MGKQADGWVKVNKGIYLLGDIVEVSNPYLCDEIDEEMLIQHFWGVFFYGEKKGEFRTITEAKRFVKEAA